jgi:hypothetical protein
MAQKAVTAEGIWRAIIPVPDTCDFSAKTAVKFPRPRPTCGVNFLEIAAITAAILLS